VAGVGDVNGDGFGELIVGQSYFSGEHELAGRALVYFGSPKGLAGGTFWRPPGQEFGFEFRSVVLPFPNLAWTVAFLLAVLSGMFALARFYYQRRERLAADVQVNRDAALREKRMRISQDLHDQLGAHLTGIALATGNVRRAVSGAGEKVNQSLSGIETTASQLADNLAEIVWLTRPTNDSLEQLVNYLLDYTGKTLEPADIMLMDINLPGMNGVECVQQLKPRMPDTEFMMLTIFEDHELVYESLVAGATGYLVKKTRPEELLEAIRELFAGGSPMSSSIARKVVAAFTTRRPHDEIYETDVLSEREREILEMLSRGMRYKEIAAKIYLSVHTVRTHLHNIYQKLHVTSKSAAI